MEDLLFLMHSRCLKIDFFFVIPEFVMLSSFLGDGRPLSRSLPDCPCNTHCIHPHIGSFDIVQYIDLFGKLARRLTDVLRHPRAWKLVNYTQRRGAAAAGLGTAACKYLHQPCHATTNCGISSTLQLVLSTRAF